MADIFLSYSREDRAAVEPLADALMSAGYSLWWDRQLVGGSRYLQETEAALKAAKFVLVVWTKSSIASHWVADEAAAGRDTGRLVPISLDGSTPPLGYRQFQVIDFTQWTASDATAFADLLGALGRAPQASGEAATAPLRGKPAGGKSATLRRPVALGVIGFLVLAAIGFAVLARPQDAGRDATSAERTAFFGFSSYGADPTVAEIAKSATSETFNTLNALGLPSASGSETENIERGAQLARAKELGARYALAGEVRRESDQFSVVIRLEDVDARATLLQDTLTGGDEQKIALPVQAAARATNAVRCYVNVRAGLRTETEEMLQAMSRVCAVSNPPFIEQAEKLRDLARLMPDSSNAQSSLALWLFLAMSSAPPSYHPAMRKEIDEAVRRAQEIDPANRLARVIRADLSGADGKDLAETEKLFLAARDADPNLFFLNIRYGMFLGAVGRYQESLNYLRTAVRSAPLTSGLRVSLAYTLAASGRPSEAEDEFRYNITRLPDDGATWSTWVQSALFDGAGEPGEVLKLAPANVSRDTVACIRKVVDSVRLQNVKPRPAADLPLACPSAGGSLASINAIRPEVVLGRIPEAFKTARRGINAQAYTFTNASVLFTTTLRPMRADPGFLPLVKELGIYKYWIDTGTHPDSCEKPDEQDLEVCRELRKAQEK